MKIKSVEGEGLNSNFFYNLFLYTSALTNQNRYKKFNLLHFIPFLAAILVLIPFYNLSFEEKAAVFKNKGKGYETLISILYAAIVFSGIPHKPKPPTAMVCPSFIMSSRAARALGNILFIRLTFFHVLQLIPNNLK